MKTKQSVTICIPSFNEAKNLKRLIPVLLNQQESSYVLSRILIASDGSTDNTLHVIREINDKRIVVIKGKERKGIAFRQNQLFNEADSSIVVLLNADIALKDQSFIEKLVNPILKHRADITSSALEETKPRTFFETALYISMQVKKHAFYKFKNGNNVYTCRGPVRAFKRELYKSLHFPTGIGEDAYSYLFAIHRGFRFLAVKNTCAYYTLPSNYKDHQRQSMRFLRSQSNFISKFGELFVHEEYSLPMRYVLEASIYYGVTHPLHAVWYLLIFCNIKARALFRTVQTETWEIATSSKFLNIEL